MSDNSEQMIKKGVVEGETEETPVKTASDEISEQVRVCKPACRCNCSKEQEVKDEQD